MVKFVYSIEGNIGSGKSTIIEMLSGILSEEDVGTEILFFREPVDFWRLFKDSETEANILSLFYEDQEKYAFSFQVLIFISRIKALEMLIEDSNEDSILIMDRSIFCDIHVFSKMLLLNKIKF